MEEHLNRFIRIVMHNINPEYLTNFYCNIKDLKIKNKYIINNPFSNTIMMGEYDSKKNEIGLLELDESIIYHELFHMASSRYEDKGRYEGFATNRYKDVNGYVGYGLNEGYTELLTRSFFKTDTDISNSYKYMVYMATLIEIIVGKEKMQKYYFNADLEGLINELSNYITLYSAEELIANLDYLRLYLDSNRVVRKKNIIKIIKDVRLTLFTIYVNKLANSYYNKEINREDLIKKIYSYNDLLINDDINQIDANLSDEEIYKCLNDAFFNIDESIAQDYSLIRTKDN